jgi:diguanylate cyclase (GGDEF)-like protein
MTDQAETISVVDVQRLQATGFPWLYFPPAIESRFERDTGWARCKFLIVVGLTCLFMFDLFLVRDYQMLPDVFPQAVVVRLLILTPLALAMFAALFFNPRPWLREAMEATMMVLVVCGILYLLMESRSPLADHAFYSLLLIVLFSNLIQRVRFWYAVVSSIVAMVLAAAAVPHIDTMPAATGLGAMMSLVTATVLSLIANYNLEHEQRRNYLVALRDVLHREQLVELNKELSVISTVDAVTGLANRHRLERYLAALWETALESGRPVTMLMLDIDHFKRFNDHYGHQAGDQCLKKVADIIRAQLRAKEDLAVRYGGEEFIIVLPDAGLIDGIRIGERIRRTLEALRLPHLASPEPHAVTVSIGVSCGKPSASLSPHELIEAADVALYNAKNRGRNRIWPPMVASDATLVPAMEAGRDFASQSGRKA